MSARLSLAADTCSKKTRHTASPAALLQWKRSGYVCWLVSSDARGISLRSLMAANNRHPSAEWFRPQRKSRGRAAPEFLNSGAWSHHKDPGPFHLSALPPSMCAQSSPGTLAITAPIPGLKSGLNHGEKMPCRYLWLLVTAQTSFPETSLRTFLQDSLARKVPHAYG